MILREFNGTDIIQFRNDGHRPGKPEFANLTFSAIMRRAPDQFAGAGLYSVHFDGRLIYVGKFLGERGDTFGGDIEITRWTRHMGTLTLRGRGLSIGTTNISLLQHSLLDHPVIDMIKSSDPIALARDYSCRTILGRVGFAMEHWDTLATFDEATLARFYFIYAQTNPRLYDGVFIRSAISMIEKKVINECKPRGNFRKLDAADSMATIDDMRIIFTRSISPLSRGIAFEPNATAHTNTE